MDLISEVVTNVPFDGGNAAVLLPRMTLPLPPGPSEQEFFMKRSASFRNDIPSGNHQNLAASTAQWDTDVTDEGSAVERTDQEIDHHRASQDPDQTASMPFPGPYAYALLPTAAGQPGQAEVPAALNPPATTYASSTATTTSASAEAPAGSAMPEAAQNGQKGNPDGLPPLLLAARLGDLDQLRMLLAQPGTDVMQAHVDGLTALHIAAREGHAAVVECLVDAGADVSHEVPQTASTALMIGSKKGRLDVVKALLRHPGILVDQINNLGDTALIFASLKGHAAIVECLIDAGADVNHVVDNNKDTPLTVGSANGKLDVVKVLLKGPGILVDLEGADGTALSNASEQGHLAIVECLINAGADRALLDSNDDSCLHLATDRGRANVVEYLLGLGAPLPNPRPRPSPDAEHFECLSDLYLDRCMPPASADNPLRLRDPGLLDHGNHFLVKLTNINTQICQNPVAEIAKYLGYTGILNAVIAPLMRGLGEFNDVRNVLAPEVKSLARQQLLVYCASTVSRLAVLAPNQQIAALYLKAGLSEAGVARFSMLGIAQRDQLVALAEEFVAQHASNVLNRLMPACLAKTGLDFQLDAKALRTTLIDAGLIPMLADMLATCWNDTLKALATMPVAVPQMGSIGEMMASIRKRVEADGPSMFAREILQQLDGAGLLRQWHDTLGKSKTEGLFFLFDDQCRQLRQYAAQMAERGE